MHAGAYEAALALIDGPAAAAAALAAPLAYERAYCLYRVGRFEDALAAVAGCAEARPAAALQLEAQLLYRMGRPKAAIQAYDRLFQALRADALELKTNVLAAYVSAQLAADLPELMGAMKARRDALSSPPSFFLSPLLSWGLLGSGWVGGVLFGTASAV